MKERRMTEEERQNLIAYRLEQAHESLQTAADNIQDSHFGAAINRIYYGSYYALSALLLKYEFEFGTHSGAKTLFGKHFIATGKIPRKYSTIYGQLFNARNESDYEAFVYFEEEKTNAYLSEAREFVSMIEEYLAK